MDECLILLFFFFFAYSQLCAHVRGKKSRLRRKRLIFLSLVNIFRASFAMDRFHSLQLKKAPLNTERRPSHWDERLAPTFDKWKCNMRRKRWCKMSSIITVIWWLAERNWPWIWYRTIVKRRWCPRHVGLLRPQQIDDFELIAIDRWKIN